MGTTVYSVGPLAVSTVDPFIEEIVKVLPVAVLLMLRVNRRQWSITDCVLTCAAVGSGFGLAEMKGLVAWNIVFALSVLSQAWMAWHVSVGARSWPNALRLPVGDDVAVLGLRIACGLGAVALGGYSILLICTGDHFGVWPTGGIATSYNVLLAIGGMALGEGLILGGGPVGMFGGSFVFDWGAKHLVAGGKDLFGDPPKGPDDEDIAFAEYQLAKTEWETAEAGRAAAAKTEAEFNAKAIAATAAAADVIGNWGDARDAANAAMASGDQAAILRTKLEEAAADAASRKADRAAEAAEAIHQGSLDAKKAAEEAADAAAERYKSAAKAIGHFKFQ